MLVAGMQAVNKNAEERIKDQKMASLSILLVFQELGAQ